MSAVLVTPRTNEQTTKGTSIDALLSEIQHGGADAVLARTGYAEIAETAAV